MAVEPARPAAIPPPHASPPKPPAATTAGAGAADTKPPSNTPSRPSDIRKSPTNSYKSPNNSFSYRRFSTSDTRGSKDDEGTADRAEEGADVDRFRSEIYGKRWGAPSFSVPNSRPAFSNERGADDAIEEDSPSPASDPAKPSVRISPPSAADEKDELESSRSGPSAASEISGALAPDVKDEAEKPKKRARKGAATTRLSKDDGDAAPTPSPRKRKGGSSFLLLLESHSFYHSYARLISNHADPHSDRAGYRDTQVTAPHAPFVHCRLRC